MPGCVVQLDVRLPSAQIFRFDGIFETVEIGGLRMRPLLAAVQPLEAVVIEVTPESDTRWKGTVAKRCEGAETGDFVDVANYEDVALGRSLFAGQ